MVSFLLFIAIIFLFIVNEIDLQRSIKLERRVKVIELDREPIKEEPLPVKVETPSWVECSACKNMADKNTVTVLKVDLPMNQEGSVILPLNLNICEECMALA